MGCGCGKNRQVVTSAQAEAQRLSAVAQAESVVRAAEARIAADARARSDALAARMNLETAKASSGEHPG